MVRKRKLAAYKDISDLNEAKGKGEHLLEQENLLVPYCREAYGSSPTKEFVTYEGIHYSNGHLFAMVLHQPRQTWNKSLT